MRIRERNERDVAAGRLEYNAVILHAIRGRKGVARVCAHLGGNGARIDRQSIPRRAKPRS